MLFMSNLVMADEEVSFEQVVYIKASKAEVWKALTDPDTISKYYLCPVLTMGTKKGEALSFGVQDTVLIEGEILELEKEKTFSHTFKFIAAHPEAKEDKPTTVTYEITDQDGLLQLVLVHSGFAERNDTYEHVTGGWPYILSNLKTYLETGKTLKE